MSRSRSSIWNRWSIHAGWIGLAWIGLAGTAQAQVNVAATLVAREDAKETTAPDPNKLNDIVRVKVNADSSAGVVRVTFEVDDQFRAEVKKPPFLYDWDTLNENDGQHTIAVTAYNANGQTGVQRLKVVVENKLSLGIKHFAAQTLAAFRKGDGLELTRAARKAFRINPGDPGAIRAMALSIGVQGDVGRAFQMLDDRQSNIPPMDPVTLEIRGYLLLARGLSRPKVPEMLPDLQAGMTLVRQRAATLLKEALAANPEERGDAAAQIARGDAFFMNNQAELALAAYEKAEKSADSAPARRRVQHRLVMALLQLGREKEAEKRALQIAKGTDGNATSAAVLGTVLHRQRKYQMARDTVREGVQSRNVAALAVATLSDLAMGARTMAYKEAREAVNTADMAETQYIAQAALADAGDFEGARKSFQIAFLRAPLFMPTLTSRAYEVMAYGKEEDRFVQALNLFDIVLRGEPDNAAAIAGRLAAYMQLKRYNAAQPLFQKLSSLEPTAPDLFIMISINYDRNIEQHTQSLDALGRARKIDPINYKDTIVPQMTDLIVRMTRLRREIPLTPALLDRAEMPNPPETTTRTATK